MEPLLPHSKLSAEHVAEWVALGKSQPGNLRSEEAMEWNLKVKAFRKTLPDDAARAAVSKKQFGHWPHQLPGGGGEDAVAAAAAAASAAVSAAAAARAVAREGAAAEPTKRRKDDKKVSHALSQILRHKALDRGLLVAADGFVGWAALAELDSFAGVSWEQIEKVVADNDKQRFKTKTERATGATYIRGNL